MNQNDTQLKDPVYLLSLELLDAYLQKKPTAIKIMNELNLPCNKAGFYKAAEILKTRLA